MIYLNFRIHYHWERCHDDGNKTGEYGKLGDDGFQYKTWYYADATGYHPKVTKTEFTPEQKSLMAEYSERTFIIPKVKLVIDYSRIVKSHVRACSKVRQTSPYCKVRQGH